MIVAETERLTLRHLEEEDAPFVLRQVNEPSWLRFIGDRGVRNLADARRFVRDGPQASYARHGYGVWCVVEKASGEPVGICGFVRRDALPEADVGFAFLPEAWGKGYATESARAAIALGRSRHGLRRVIAITTEDNSASRRVLDRLGFAPAGTTRLPGEERELLLYALES
jgi:RimJ/RimL family protein N-acetyltransferase